MMMQFPHDRPQHRLLISWFPNSHFHMPKKLFHLFTDTKTSSMRIPFISYF